MVTVNTVDNNTRINAAKESIKAIAGENKGFRYGIVVFGSEADRFHVNAFFPVIGFVYLGLRRPLSAASAQIGFLGQSVVIRKYLRKRNRIICRR